MNTTKTILVIEDTIPLINALYNSFTKEGFNVIKATDGKSGLEIALTQKPDLIFLDINLPVMDGMTMLKELRKDEASKDTEVVLLTNSMGYKMVADALALGAHDYLVKSDVKLEDLIKLAHEKLQQ